MVSHPEIAELWWGTNVQQFVHQTILSEHTCHSQWMIFNLYIHKSLTINLDDLCWFMHVLCMSPHDSMLFTLWVELFIMPTVDKTNISCIIKAIVTHCTPLWSIIPNAQRQMSNVRIKSWEFCWSSDVLLSPWLFGELFINGIKQTIETFPKCLWYLDLNRPVNPSASNIIIIIKGKSLLGHMRL